MPVCLAGAATPRDVPRALVSNGRGRLPSPPDRRCAARRVCAQRTGARGYGRQASGGHSVLASESALTPHTASSARGNTPQRCLVPLLGCQERVLVAASRARWHTVLVTAQHGPHRNCTGYLCDCVRTRARATTRLQKQPTHARASTLAHPSVVQAASAPAARCAAPKTRIVQSVT